MNETPPYRDLMQVVPYLERALGVWVTPTLGFEIAPNDTSYRFPLLDRVFEACRPVIERWCSEVRPTIEAAPELDSIPHDEVDGVTPFWNNPYYHTGDARLLYAVMKRHRPKTVIEIGFGHSTRFIRRAISDHRLNTRVVCIDPSPRTEITQVADEILPQSCTQVDPSFFLRHLRAGDVLFIDGSHLVMNGSDCVHLYLNVLPALPDGVLVHIHDVFLPWDYAYDLHIQCRYNEQYIVAAMLLYGTEWTPVLPIHYAYHIGALPHGGGAFWMVKQKRPT